MRNLIKRNNKDVPVERKMCARRDSMGIINPFLFKIVNVCKKWWPHTERIHSTTREICIIGDDILSYDFFQFLLLHATKTRKEGTHEDISSSSSSPLPCNLNFYFFTNNRFRFLHHRIAQYFLCMHMCVSIASATLLHSSHRSDNANATHTHTRCV